MLDHLGEISAEELAKQYRCSAPKGGKLITLPDGAQVPPLVCNPGTVMHNLLYAHHVYHSKKSVGTSGIGASEGRRAPLTASGRSSRRWRRPR